MMIGSVSLTAIPDKKSGPSELMAAISFSAERTR
jgi:hypothetical protein